MEVTGDPPLGDEEKPEPLMTAQVTGGLLENHRMVHWIETGDSEVLCFFFCRMWDCLCERLTERHFRTGILHFIKVDLIFFILFYFFSDNVM